jgi:hypothetical protein
MANPRLRNTDDVKPVGTPAPKCGLKMTDVGEKGLGCGRGFLCQRESLF